jgi:hypothetical protein
MGFVPLLDVVVVYLRLHFITPIEAVFFPTG